MIERAELAVESLTVDPLQSRNHSWSGDELDQQLAASIDEDGLFHDVLVRPLDAVDVGVTTDTADSAESGHGTTTPEYAIIAGSRRYHAAMEAGRETLPCKIITADDLEAAWASLNENTDRRELSEQEIASQLNLIYELVRPRGDDTTDSSPPDTPAALSMERFETDEAALEYLAERYYGRTDDGAIGLIEGHLRTANLPPVLQALFKDADERTARETRALDNYGIDARTTLGSGEGKSGTSREVVALHDTLADELAADSLDATDAVLDAVGSLQHDEMSEQELRRSLREFRNEVSAELDDSAVDQHDQVFRETLQRHAEELRELHEEIEPKRPFKKVDVLGPETHRHSRYHAHAMQARNADSHSALVRELYTERLEALAEQRGWK
jgi:hypothetical protein